MPHVLFDHAHAQLLAKELRSLDRLAGWDRTYVEPPNGPSTLPAFARTAPRVLLTLTPGKSSDNLAMLQAAQRHRSLVQVPGHGMTTTRYLVDARWGWRSPSEAYHEKGFIWPRVSEVVENPFPHNVCDTPWNIDRWQGVRSLYATNGFAFYQYVSDVHELHNILPLIDGVVLDAPLGHNEQSILKEASLQRKGAIIRL